MENSCYFFSDALLLNENKRAKVIHLKVFHLSQKLVSFLFDHLVGTCKSFFFCEFVGYLFFSDTKVSKDEKKAKKNEAV